MKIIAECGCNHTSIREAKEMIKKAKDVGCWATKFQLFSKEQAKEVKIPLRLSLSKSQAKSLVTYGKYVGINVFFTPMDLERVAWCEEIGVDFIKVRYRDNLDRDLYKAIKKTKKKTFISVGGEYNDLWQNFIDYKKGVFMYCVPEYPAEIEDYLEKFDPHKIQGISDHTPDTILLKGIHYLGVIEYFEKHVCLTKDCLESAWSCTFKELSEALK